MALGFRERMQRRGKIALAAAAAATGVVLIGSFAFGKLVRSAAEDRAEARGLTLTIGSVSPGWGRVWLEDVQVSAAGVPGVRVRLDSVEVDLTLGLGVERVVAHGGSLRLEGSEEALRSQVNAWRSRQPPATDGNGERAFVEYVAEGLYVVWFDGTERPQRLWGARCARRPEGREELSADRGELRFRGVEVRLEAPELALQRRGRQRVVERLAAKSVEARFDVDLARITGAALAAREDGDGAIASALAGLGLDSDLPPPRPAASSPKKTPGGARRGAELRGAFARLAGVVESALPPGGELDLAALRVEVGREERIGVGPGRLHVRRDAERVSLSFAPGKTDKERSPLTVELDVPIAAGPVRARIAGGPLSLAALGAREGEIGLLDVQGARIEAKGEALLSDDGGDVAFSGEGKLTNLALAYRRLAEGPVRGLNIGWRGRMSAALDGSRIAIAESRLEVGNVRFDVSGEVEQTDDQLQVRVAGGVPLASCDDLMRALPSGIAPLLTDVALTGTFALDVQVAFDSRRPAAAVARWNMQNDCRVAAAPNHILPRRFFSPFQRVVDGADRKPVLVDTGPGTPDWVPYGGISPHMPTAVVICEDAAFFRHRGFDSQAIENSIKDNLKTGRFMRGASTVSMQLTKNLYLSRDKTLARKLQEAVLTMLLEQELSKEEILELYLNVIEYGPGIYGIAQAARHYFATTPDQLTLGQSLYLASILPNPRQQHFTASGELSEGWTRYLHKLMHIALKIRRIDEQQLEEALAETIAFRMPGARPELQPGDEIVRDEAIFGAYKPDSPGDED